MSATIGNATPGSRPEPISVTYRRLQRMGFHDVEAANLTALKNGFGIPGQPWTVRELAHLLFLRETCRAGDRWSDADDRVTARRVAAPVDRAPTPTTEVGASSATRSGRRDNADPTDGAVTLLTLLRSMAGPNATLDLLRGSASTQPNTTGDANREDR